jgi:hypothetical protein
LEKLSNPFGIFIYLLDNFIGTFLEFDNFMLTKKQVLSAVKNMPDTFDTIQLFDRILLINKVEEGRLQLKAGKGLSTEEAKKKLKKWLK